jgi:hypothetical protein
MSFIWGRLTAWKSEKRDDQKKEDEPNTARNNETSGDNIQKPTVFRGEGIQIWLNIVTRYLTGRKVRDAQKIDTALNFCEESIVNEWIYHYPNEKSGKHLWK